MKQKTIILIAVVILLLIATSSVLAGAKNALYFEWTWQGAKSGYFQMSTSGIVHMWSYDRPAPDPDIHFVIKPLDKFPDASCDEGVIKVKAGWTPQGIFNSLNPGQDFEGYEAFWGGDLSKLHYLCGYPMD